MSRETNLQIAEQFLKLMAEQAVAEKIADLFAQDLVFEIPVRPEHLALVPDAIDDVVAASLPVAYLTARVTLTLAGFRPA